MASSNTEEFARIIALGALVGRTSLISAIIEKVGVDGYLEFLNWIKADIEAEKESV